jgi:hypothetical protein
MPETTEANDFQGRALVEDLQVPVTKEVGDG